MRKNLIALNGHAEDDMDHESFIIGDANPLCTFTKTARKPYDEVVTAILITAWIQGLLVPTSDGNFEDWSKGIALFENKVRPLSVIERNALRRLLD